MTYQQITIDSVLFLVLVISIITDIKSRKILNIVTFPTMGIGIALNTTFFYLNGYGLGGLKFSGIGLVVGLFVFGIFAVFGGIGMGDVKLMGAIGALKGGLFALFSIAYIGIAGGVLAIIYLIWKGVLLETLHKVVLLFLSPFSKSSREKLSSFPKLYIPYGPAIFVGVIWYYLAIFFKIEIV